MTNVPSKEDMMEDEDARAAPHAPARRVALASHAEVLQKLIVRRAQPEAFSFEEVELPLSPPPSDGVPFDRLAATALGRTADRLYGLPVFITGVEMKPATPAELAELFPERALLAIVQGQADHLGVVALCPSLIASLIEMQAIGRVSARPVRPRKPTRTDAAISADFVNALLRELNTTLQSGDELPDFASFSYVSFLDDIRPLMLMIDEGALATLTLRFRIGTGGQRNGELIVALPQVKLAQIGAAGFGAAEFGMITHAADFADSAPTPSFADDSFGDDGAGFGLQGDDPQGMSLDGGFLRQEVQAAPLTLVGVLCRRAMTLRALRALSAGDVIPLAGGVLGQARIETLDGQLLATGKLGEAEGQYAIRLRAPDMGQGGDTGITSGAAPFAPQASSLPNHDLDEMISNDDSEPQIKTPIEIDMDEPDDFRAQPLPVLDTSFEDDEAGEMMDLSSLANFS